MLLRALTAALLLTIATHSSRVLAQPLPFGVGLIGGEPCGLSMKMWFGSYLAIDAAAGVDFGAPSRNPFLYSVPPSFQVHTDFLLHLPLIRRARLRMPLYLGVGAKFNWLEGFQPIRARTPIGLAFLIPRKPWPWELFVEFVPTWGHWTFDPDVAGGVRYYF